MPDRLEGDPWFDWAKITEQAAAAQAGWDAVLRAPIRTTYGADPPEPIPADRLLPEHYRAQFDDLWSALHALTAAIYPAVQALADSEAPTPEEVVRFGDHLRAAGHALAAALAIAEPHVEARLALQEARRSDQRQRPAGTWRAAPPAANPSDLDPPPDAP